MIEVGVDCGCDEGHKILNIWHEIVLRVIALSMILADSGIILTDSTSCDTIRCLPQLRVGA